MFPILSTILLWNQFLCERSLQIMSHESPDLDFEYDDSDRYEVEIAGKKLTHVIVNCRIGL